MSSTNRDVTINVTVNPQMDKASDGLQQIGIRASEAEKEVAKLLERLEAVSKGHNGGATVIDIQDPVPAAGVSNAQPQQQQTVNRGNGGATVVDDPNQLSDAERAMAHSAGKIQRQRQKAQENQQAGHQKISDNDVANAVKATNKAKQEAKEAAEEEARAVKAGAAAQEAYVGASRAAAMSAMEFAKGLALVAASGDDNNDSLIRGIAQIQGYFNLIRGGMSTMQAFNDALKARAALQAAGAVAGEAKGAAGGAATASSAANAAGAATAIPGGMSALANPYVLIAAAVASALLAKRAMNQWAVEDHRHANEVETSYAAMQSKHADLAVGRHFDQAIRRSNAVPNYGQMRQGAINQQRRSQIEHEIRKQQDGSDRDFGAKQEMRSRAEEAGGIIERQAEARNNLTHATAQQKSLHGARERLEADVRTSREAHENHVRKIKDSMRKETGVGRIEGAITGKESDNSAAIYNKEREKELAAEIARYAGEKVKQEEASRSLAEQDGALAEKRAAAAAQLLSTLREQTAAARRNHEQDKQTVASANQSLGAMSYGDRHILKQIEAKRKAGGKAEQWEINRALSAPVGTKLHDWGLNQAEAMGEADGGLEKSPDVTESEKKQDNAVAKQAKEEPELQELIKAQSDAAVKSAKLVETVTEAVAKAQERDATVIALFEQQTKQIEESIRILKRNFR